MPSGCRSRQCSAVAAPARKCTWQQNEPVISAASVVASTAMTCGGVGALGVLSRGDDGYGGDKRDDDSDADEEIAAHAHAAQQESLLGSRVNDWAARWSPSPSVR